MTICLLTVGIFWGEVNEVDFPRLLKHYIYDIVSPCVKSCVQNLGSENFSIATNVFPVKTKDIEIKVAQLSHNNCGAFIIINIIIIYVHYYSLGLLLQL